MLDDAIPGSPSKLANVHVFVDVCVARNIKAQRLAIKLIYPNRYDCMSVGMCIMYG